MTPFADRLYKQDRLETNGSKDTITNVYILQARLLEFCNNEVLKRQESKCILNVVTQLQTIVTGEDKQSEPSLKEPSIKDPEVDSKVEEPEVELPNVEEQKVEEPKVEKSDVNEQKVETTKEVPVPVIQETKKPQRPYYETPRRAPPPTRLPFGTYKVLQRRNRPKRKPGDFSRELFVNYFDFDTSSNDYLPLDSPFIPVIPRRKIYYKEEESISSEDEDDVVVDVKSVASDESEDEKDGDDEQDEENDDEEEDEDDDEEEEEAEDGDTEPIEDSSETSKEETGSCEGSDHDNSE